LTKTLKVKSLVVDMSTILNFYNPTKSDFNFVNIIEIKFIRFDGAVA